MQTPERGNGQVEDYIMRRGHRCIGCAPPTLLFNTLPPSPVSHTFPTTRPAYLGSPTVRPANVRHNCTLLTFSLHCQGAHICLSNRLFVFFLYSSDFFSLSFDSVGRVSPEWATSSRNCEPTQPCAIGYRRLSIVS